MNFIDLPSRIFEKIAHSECDFVLTGGGGWVGRAILDALEKIFPNNLDKKVSVFGSGDKVITLLSGKTINSKALPNIASLPPGPKIYLHLAFLTRDRLDNISPQELIDKNGAIRDLLATQLKNTDARGLFSLSSGAVYKKNTHELETDWIANSYGMCKIEDEKLFSRLTREKNISFCMPRLFNLSGPYINKHETYALASMILSALRHRNILIRAPHEVYRSYIAVDDLISLAFASLLDEQSAGAGIFDTAGDEVLELDALAEKIKEVLNAPDIKITRGPITPAEPDRYLGEGKKLCDLARHYDIHLKKIAPQIASTVSYLQKIYQ